MNIDFSRRAKNLKNELSSDFSEEGRSGRSFRKVASMNAASSKNSSLTQGSQNARFDSSSLHIHSGGDSSDEAEPMFRQQSKPHLSLAQKGPRRRSSYRLSQQKSLSTSLHKSSSLPSTGQHFNLPSCDELRRALNHVQIEEGHISTPEPVAPSIKKNFSPSLNLRESFEKTSASPRDSVEKTESFKKRTSFVQRRGVAKVDNLFCRQSPWKRGPDSKILRFILYGVAVFSLGISYLRTSTLSGDFHNMIKHHKKVADSVSDLNKNIEQNDGIVSNILSELDSLKKANEALALKTTTLERDSKYHQMEEREEQLILEKDVLKRQVQMYKQRDSLLVDRVNLLIDKIQLESYRTVYER